LHECANIYYVTKTALISWKFFGKKVQTVTNEAYK